MAADATHLLYGIRYQVSDPTEVKLLQTGQHVLIKAAKKAGLQIFWGNFDLDGGEYYLLYVGRQISTLGLEGVSDVEVSDTELTQIQIETRRKLIKGGFSLIPALFAQFEPDV